MTQPAPDVHAIGISDLRPGDQIVGIQHDGNASPYVACTNLTVTDAASAAGATGHIEFRNRATDPAGFTRRWWSGIGYTDHSIFHVTRT
ncbi:MULTISPECIES: hypothetical protein [unclassified Mycobacteroides]|uniref:hypothetical protein n=1 Tax=unclassified Mycobacteroides TaxID=2618759 RepID=UPI000AE7CD32|nr:MULTISPECIES: hypothetical protein [unclassified Mycobacteroides]